LKLKNDEQLSNIAFKFNLRRYREGNSSQFKGVTWVKRSGKWMAQFPGKGLGYHATEEAAAQAYNIEAERLGLPGVQHRS